VCRQIRFLGGSASGPASIGLRCRAVASVGLDAVVGHCSPHCCCCSVAAAAAAAAAAAGCHRGAQRAEIVGNDVFVDNGSVNGSVNIEVFARVFRPPRNHDAKPTLSHLDRPMAEYAQFPNRMVF